MHYWWLIDSIICILFIFLLLCIAVYASTTFLLLTEIDVVTTHGPQRQGKSLRGLYPSCFHELICYLLVEQ